jgi:hypothetical protein
MYSIHLHRYSVLSKFNLHYSIPTHVFNSPKINITSLFTLNPLNALGSLDVQSSYLWDK